MELQMTTPALLFSTNALLLMAFTNRFLSTAQVIRNLHDRYQKSQEEMYLKQINNLRHRLRLTRNMQFFLVVSLLLSVVCMFLIFAENDYTAKWVFGASMLSLVYSLVLSSWEIYISTQALEMQLTNIEQSDVGTLSDTFKAVFNKDVKQPE
jgi:hypothetical protein